jgi:NAD kinase
MQAIVLYKESKYSKWLKRKEEPQYMHFFEKAGKELTFMMASHETQTKCMNQIWTALKLLGIRYDAYQLDQANFQPASICRSTTDIVLAVGGDGTFLSASRYVLDAPLLGVNSDPNTSLGFHCAATSADLKETLRNLERQKMTRLARLEAIIDGVPFGIAKNGAISPLYAVNEILVRHKTPETSIEFMIEADGFSQSYKIDGVVACTGAGSTGLMYNLRGEVMDIIDTRIQYKAFSLRNEPPRFTRELRITSLNPQAIIKMDNCMHYKPLDIMTTVLIREGQPLYVYGDLREKQESYR